MKKYRGMGEFTSHVRFEVRNGYKYRFWSDT
jgi:hypothetical protein